jgi:uncharacterized membrane protein
MAKWLIVAAVAWPIVAGAAVWQRVAGRDSAWTAGLYLAASRVCHQRPDRSFQTAGVQWPVCSRCAGLYLGAPVGALLAIVPGLAHRWRRSESRWWIAAAAMPTAVTLALEWMADVHVTNAARAAAALPLGVAVAAAIVRVAAQPAKTIR